jgi:hypothetical protein
MIGGDGMLMIAMTERPRKRKAGWWGALMRLVEEEEEAQLEAEEDERQTRAKREQFEEDHGRQLYAWSGYFRRLQNEYAELDEVERCRLKRTRVSACSIGAAVATQQSVQRRLWVKNRSQAWYVVDTVPLRRQPL